MLTIKQSLVYITALLCLIMFGTLYTCVGNKSHEISFTLHVGIPGGHYITLKL